MDALDATKTFAQQLGLDYPLLSDPDRAVARAYGVITGEQAFASRWTFYIGVDGRILYIDKNVRVTTAGGAIAGKLAELGVARRKSQPRR